RAEKKAPARRAAAGAFREVVCRSVADEHSNAVDPAIARLDHHDGVGEGVVEEEVAVMAAAGKGVAGGRERPRGDRERGQRDGEELPGLRHCRLLLLVTGDTRSPFGEPTLGDSRPLSL